MATELKRILPKSDEGLLGIFHINQEYESYQVSDSNKAILENFMMSNGVITNDRNEAKKILLKRDNSAIDDLNEESYTSGKLGTACLSTYEFYF